MSIEHKDRGSGQLRALILNFLFEGSGVRAVIGENGGRDHLSGFYHTPVQGHLHDGKTDFFPLNDQLVLFVDFIFKSNQIAFQ